MKSYIINFIRHGLTQSNLDSQFAGFLDVPVCEEGMIKLNKLKESYEYPKVQRYYSSSLTRCIQTCNVFYPGVEPILLDGLKECNFGDWEGKTYDELAYCDENVEWMRRGNNVIPPNGESWSDFYSRISETFEKIVDDLVHKGITSSAIFTHGGVIMTILSKYGIPKKPHYEWIVSNGCGYSVRITPSLWMRDKVFEVEERLPYGVKESFKGEIKQLMHE